MEDFAKCKVGDLITAYHKGFWKVIKVERRFWGITDGDRYIPPGKNKGEEYSSLIHYKKIADATGKPAKTGQEKCCDAGFITVITKAVLDEQMDNLCKQHANLLENLTKLGELTNE